MLNAKDNPYSIDHPAKDLFYGRQEQLEKLTTSLSAPTAGSYALIGGRRFGKTSLLFAIERSLWAKFALPIYESYRVIPVYLSLFNAELTSSGDFYSFAIGALADQVDANCPGVAIDEWNTSLPADLNRPPHQVFADKILGLCRIISLQGVPTRVLLLIDETEEILDRPWTRILFNQLRWLTYENSRTHDYLKIILAGSSNFYHNVKQMGSPLEGVLTFEYLAAFSEKEVRRLAQEPCDGQLSKALADKISACSGGHPYLVQYIMHHLWQENLSDIQLKHVDELSEKFIRERWDQLERWRKSIGEVGCRAYSILLSHDGWLEERVIRQALGGPQPELVPALTALCYHGWAVHDDEWRYHAVGDLVRNWFNEHTDLATVSKDPVKTDSSFSEVKVFISYSHADSRFVDDNKTSLLSFVRGLERKGVTFWWDRRLNAGDMWDDEIKSQMKKADIALVLVSQAFLNSSYCTDREARSFIKSRKSRGLKIIPVILSACNWSDHDWLEKTMVLPREGKNIESHYQNKGKRKELYLEILRAIEKACKEHHPS